MSDSILSFRKEDHVLVIDISQPVDNTEKLFRLSDELLDLRTEITGDEKIRVIVLTGTGDHPFRMAIDPVGILSKAKEESRYRFPSVAEPMANLDQPVIAAIKGDAVGQGLELALACDIRIATETSHFGFPHIQKGLIPGDGGTQRLSRLVGRGKAMEMILTGETIDAKEAYRIGLVNKVVSSPELMKEVMDTAREMASKGRAALRYAKEAIHKGMDLTLEQGLRLEADLYFLLHTTRDRTEGIQAFREKRPPQFEEK